MEALAWRGMAVRWIDAIADLAIFEAADPASASRRASVDFGLDVGSIDSKSAVLVFYAATIDVQAWRRRALGR